MTAWNDRRTEPDTNAALHKAFLNILEDAAEERQRLTDTQREIAKILADARDEAARLQSTQKAFLNILDDAADEKSRLTDAQRAALNILDDFDVERKKGEQMNADLRNEINERARAVEALRYANAETEAANRELEAFSYSVAHDLRAPLRSIDGFSLALLEDYSEHIPAEGKTYLGHVRESAQHMARLIDDLLSLSRLGRTRLHRASIDLAAIARIVAARLRRDHPDRAVEVVVPAEIAAVGDERLMEVVLENLLGNAWKFTAKRPHARIEVGEMSHEGHRVCFVRDDGAGFDMAYAGKLFSVFQRLHAVSEYEGTGIGLAIVERIVHRHGGRIWAESEVGHGATFYFTLMETT
jgi:light-regulated signal transduction histidine kinase (bacteriophytochrome)